MLILLPWNFDKIDLQERLTVLGTVAIVEGVSWCLNWDMPWDPAAGIPITPVKLGITEFAFSTLLRW